MAAPLRKYTRAQVERAVRLVKEGKSFRVAARTCRMSLGAVQDHVTSAGVVSNRKSGHRTAFAPGARPFTPEEDALIIEHRAFGRSFIAIGAALGRNRSSIRSRLSTLEQRRLRGEV